MTDRPHLSDLYNAVPYVDYPYSFAHPRRLETLAAMFGMDPPPISACRVLELGCAGGANLIPQAQDLPESTFVGVDLSEREIGAGKRTIGELRLRNIELVHADIMDIDDDWGKFDYILCHGVLSWVPPKVQEKILAVCARNMAPNGVAFVSYNTYPGWHLSNVVRDLMLYHASRFEDPGQQISQAKQLLKFAAEVSNGDGTGGKIFQEAWDVVRNSTDAYVYHDFLEPDNRPFYFSEFAGRAADHGLQFLAEAEIDTMFLQTFPEKIREALGGLPMVEQQQYLDFLQCRRFRKTLLCRREQTLERNVTHERLRNFHIALADRLKPASVGFNSKEPTRFGIGDRLLTVGNPLVEAALYHLDAVFPQYVHFDQLYATVAATQTSLPHNRGPGVVDSHLRGNDGPCGNDYLDERSLDGAEQLLAETLLAGYVAGMFDVCLHPPRCVSRPNRRPTASPLARLQAIQGSCVTNLRHEPVNLGEVHRHLVNHLDGRHDRAALAERLQEAIASGKIRLMQAGQPTTQVDSALLTLEIDHMLARLSESALLVA